MTVHSIELHDQLVWARMVKRVEDWPWSPVHVYRHPHKRDGVTDGKAVEPYLEDVNRIIDTGEDAGEEDVRFKALRQSETIGRPIGITVTSCVRPKNRLAAP